MTFTLQEKDERPLLDLRQWIFADGEIGPGTAERFDAFLTANPKIIGDATVILNSPGGSPVAGMEFGNAIRARRFRTAVGIPGAKPMTIAPGLCMSACIYPYLGGIYRYLDDGSAIGIHQFRFGEDKGGAETAKISQALSGEIVSYIKQSRADPSLFILMTQTPPENIQLIPLDELVKMEVVTGDVYSEDWGFEVHGDLSYLKADQITVRGENKLLFVCPPNKKKRIPALMVLSELPDRETIIGEAKSVILIINGKSIVVPAGAVVDTPKPSGDRYIAWAFSLTPKLASAVRMADTIGSGLSPGPPEMFAGAGGIAVGDSREKLVRFLDDCK